MAEGTSQESGPITESSFRGTQVTDDGTGPKMVEHRHRLLVVDGPDRGLEVEVPATELTIGSASSNDLVLTDGTVSRRHAMVAVQGERYLLRDLDSTNGTLVDGTRVKEAYLAPGARIELGDTEILFQPRKKWERIDVRDIDHFGGLYGTTDTMRAVFALLAKLAPTGLSCILVGETGTGKELAARAIHDHSPRAAKPFVVVDCGAISENLIESELFGHERGAFTGADRQRTGAFEAAEGGTVFLDEIGELPLELQPKLLRVLERREVKRLGSTKLQEVDVRVVAATHRDLPAMVTDGTFREDLYYRLAEVVVELPPLRDRLDDVPVIAGRILRDLAADGPVVELGEDAVAALTRRSWPGNVRELRNVLKRATVLASGPVLGAQDLKLEVAGPLRDAGGARTGGGAPAQLEVADDLPIKEARDRWVAPMEREYLVRIVSRCAGDLDRAADEAGIHRKSLERLLRQHGLKASDFR
ncbi:MAG TPA: sigma 54-interacting transcriptional regulator [Sandaracinaceae bacterium LLY-WYZ-13_1]|nr:sigma 54-interacting transcriptional regulator [Sandaracinaceae bacterium LLY-WYZ-13_1]